MRFERSSALYLECPQMSLLDTAANLWLSSCSVSTMADAHLSNCESLSLALLYYTHFSILNGWLNVTSTLHAVYHGAPGVVAPSGSGV